MFHAKPIALFVIKRDAVLAYGNKGGHADIGFTTAVLRNIEVVDPASYAKQIGDFAAKLQLRKASVLVLLDTTVIFEKTEKIAVGPARDQSQLLFQNIVPFNEADRRVLALQFPDHHVLIGTNAQLYLQLMQGLATRNIKVSAVAPITIYGKVSVPLTPQQAGEILRNAQLAERANFLDLEAKKQ